MSENEIEFLSENEDEQALRERRLQKIKAMRRQKEKQLRTRRYLKIGIPLAAILVVGCTAFTGVKAATSQDRAGKTQTEDTEQAQETDTEQTQETGTEQTQETDTEQTQTEGTEQIQTADQIRKDQTGVRPDSLAAEDAEALETIGSATNQESSKQYAAEMAADSYQIGTDVISSHAVLIDLTTNEIVASREAKTRISPASMTKILTVLVAAEHITEADLQDTFTMTLDITDYSYVNDCSNVGFLEEEEVTVKDLFYGTILPSGADAAVGLATYVAGDQESFVKLMNEKLKELGLSGTAHMTNCVGLYDENHYCTVYDMAIILEAAMDNEICRDVLSEHTYTTAATTEHPEGITISNWFLRRIEDKETGGEVLYAKTGYVVQSGNCAASYELGDNGKGYICVTAGASSAWRCIYDHVALYQMVTGTGS